jgi:DNA-binding transcriptional ArsR family regulator
MLRVTRLTDYATVVMTVLAHHSEAVLSASELAERAGLEPTTVSKVLKPLAQADLVEGFRGANGGYRLARPRRGDRPARDRRGHGRATRHDRVQHPHRQLRHRAVLWLCAPTGGASTTS